MLGAVRRQGLAQALRACAPRSISVRATPQVLRWQRPSAATFPFASRSIYSSPSLRNAASGSGAAAQAQVEEPFEQTQDRITEFEDLAARQLVSPKIIDNITKGMNIKTMTEVQSLTINETLKGDDVLAQAKTGTGKTLAFLVPVMQNILKDKSLERRSSDRRGFGRSTPTDIRAIIISPTRELAEQIAVEARKLVSNTGVVVQTAVGGTQKREGLRRIQYQGCHVLIGTPGRLNDILSDPLSGVKAPKLSAFVLDEADRLLDDGFAPAIEEIQNLLPDPMNVDRQTLMFSATVPREVMRMVRRTMKPDFKFVKTIPDDEVPTHMSVPQKAVYLNGLENSLPAVLELAKSYVEKQKQDPNLRPFKAIVYFNSTAQVSVAYESFAGLRNDPNDRRSGHPLGRMFFYEIHSRLTQRRRTQCADDFRRSTSAILFSSDVTARGMDFPDVTHVIQVGVPRDRETYIHRLGRTARANKTGEGWILIHEAEESAFRQKIGDLPIKEDTSVSTAGVNMSRENQQLPEATAETLSQVGASMKTIPYKTKSDSYRAQLGTLTSVIQSRRLMIKILNDLAKFGYGLSEPPVLSPMLARKMNLELVPGINIGHEDPEDDGDVRGGSRFGRDGRSSRFDSGDRKFGRDGFSRHGGRSDGAPWAGRGRTNRRSDDF
ncbi:putative ATP-dependent RNA helicase mss116, mitochondrial [Paecilomyces variotii]|uniref:ATP-dependent RNA helicase n=1 Tax=Byssochlamys spectabilis TaxID=264951 RepID=A0A443HK88_BYSSP|nr:putative ATP-dependent RNA helicase mss116, mitochondrial [Paecilomyces variotii]KAJ9286023.1 hypothetical protein DTO021C3_6430 [Paecilomyces variotii]KAJ9354298.1 hypothetical protein DTO280E4_6920 [Paecilomyces variotii]RWQ92177.1 putative ATP-dependent RNA helicase mss116, mitochondrial [Paecilomyces variotii]